ncbi:septum site-determining protein MinD [Laceyella sacchari]|jgi:septum site-determining protein MinD|uniref:Septum site-determining protein MinD n=3 Tax=Laceyella TaxID=292635 RepID=A0AA45WMQ2_9BACL|nr:MULTISPECIES: septum site-determining protein MinD [Laceyella]AUS09627.1 septum site-determining protein MinD [Laceyella sacchari]MRG28758.1 septum site-determining protein MinD [Laceyella tengchongensis]PRZ17318.1 septum site-determining protein MinD [Laceyella sediminis]TCW37852.1 septum site-determining protein MinD [Laceyella sacchari]UWE02985.1 septum site-determining protein MinD [Laceyella sacchari]
MNHRSMAITVTSGKGGVGKSTTVASLGLGLAQLGYKVCLVDTDIGLRKLDLMLGLENRIVYDLVDVIEGVCQLRQSLVRHKEFPELALLPAAQTRYKEEVSPDQLTAVVDELRKEFDYILIDSPAGIEGGFRNAIAPADRAILVVNPEIPSVRDSDRVIGLLEAANVKHIDLVVNRVQPGMVRDGDMLSVERVQSHLAISLLGVVPEDKRIIRSSNTGEPVILDAKSMAGKAFSNIARRIAGEDVPFLELEETNLITKIKRLFSIA